MKPNKLKSTTEKVTNVMVVAMIVAGTITFALINQVSGGTELLPKLFLLFFGAIITVQLIPGLILLGSVIKGLVTMGRKQEVPAEATVNSKEHK
jgi:hypothetical protein